MDEFKQRMTEAFRFWTLKRCLPVLTLLLIFYCLLTLGGYILVNHKQSVGRSVREAISWYEANMVLYTAIGSLTVWSVMLYYSYTRCKLQVTEKERSRSMGNQSTSLEDEI